MDDATSVPNTVRICSDLLAYIHVFASHNQNVFTDVNGITSTPTLTLDTKSNNASDDHHGLIKAFLV